MKGNNMTKKVLIGVTVDHAVPYHEGLSKGFADRGWEVHFVSTCGPNLEKLDKRVERHPIAMARQPSLMQDFKSAIEWARVVWKVKPHIVIAGTPKASMLGIFVSRILRVPARIYWVHGLRLETATGWFFRVLLALEKFTSKNSTHLISVSKSLSERLIELDIAPVGKITMIGSGSTQGVDLKKFKPVESDGEKLDLTVKLGLIPGRFTIGFVGRLAKEKGVEEFKNSLLDLQNMGESFQALILGSVEDDSGQSLLDDFKLAGIKFVSVGHVEDSAPYFRAMDLFCLPTYREGLGNVVLEAFATKLPVISTEVTGIVDLLKNEETGLLIPAKDSLSLTKAILRMMKDSALTEKLGTNALEFVSENYDADHVIASQINFMERIFDGLGEKA